MIVIPFHFLPLSERDIHVLLRAFCSIRTVFYWKNVENSGNFPYFSNALIIFVQRKIAIYYVPIYNKEEKT